MASKKHIHSEDIVRFLKSKDGSTKIGLVLRSGDNTTDSEESYDSDEDDFKVKSGEILVCWFPSGVEEVVSESKVEVMDRSLQPGDVVRHATKPNQKGYVNDIQITADISILGTNRIIKNVDCKRYILPLQPLSEGQYVTLGPWVGYVSCESRRVVLLLKNGSRCSIEGDDLDMFSDALDKRGEHSPFFCSALYPSQYVVGPAKAFNNAKWLTKVKPILADQSRIKAVVEEAKVIEVEVVWQMCGSLPSWCNKEDFKKPPDKVIKENAIDKLQVLDAYCNQIQIGDKCFYVVKEEDIRNEEIVTKDNTNESSSADVKQATSGKEVENHIVVNGTDSCCNKKKSLKCEPCTEACERNCEQTKDNVSERGSDLASDDDCPNATRHDSESDDGDVESDGPDQPKTKSSKYDSSSKPLARRKRKRYRHKRKLQHALKVKPGDKVCVEVVCTKTRADVMWQDGRLETNLDTLDLISIHHIDDHQFFPGYIVNDERTSTDSSVSGKYGVIRSASDIDRTCAVMWFSASGENLGTEEDVSVYDLSESADMAFNPGDLVVCMTCDSSWGIHEHGYAGQVVNVDQEGYVVVNWTSSGVPHRGRHRPHELYKIDSEEEDEKTESTSDTGDSSENDTWETASEDGHNADEVPDENNENQESPSAFILPRSNENPEASSPTVDNVDVEALNDANHLENQVERSVDDDTAFLMLSEVHESHHYYADHFEKAFTPDNPRKFMSVFRKETLLLRRSLPSGILIRGFENAMELFSVLITGPKDTPYEGGVFLFDIKLPADYPASPPLVFFISLTTSVLNPNLYVDGTVCTSLLGTWTGKDFETWTEKSNILQVLLSIQALILCKEPYFNEAGYEKQRGTVEGIENSRVYNEMAILHLISSMTAAIKTKHPIFDKEIRKHFQEYGQSTIDRFKSWLSHSNTSHQNSEDHGSSTSEPNSCEVSTAIASQRTEQFKIPGYPLFPLSKGFCKCLERNIELFCKTLTDEKLMINDEKS